jgi:O-antigen/teichoic acid export membrane protein
VSKKLRNLIRSFLEQTGPRLWLVADRGILAVTSMVVVVSMARLLDVPTFGAFSTILAIWFVVEVLIRGAVHNPLVVFSATTSQLRYLFGSWLLLSLLVALAGSAAIVLPLSFLLHPESYAQAVSTNAMLIVLPYAAFHSLRRAIIQKRLQYVSIWMSGTLFVANLASLGTIWAGALPADLTTACALIGTANILGAGLGWYLAGFRVALSRAYLRGLLGRLSRRRSAILSTLLLEGPGTGLFSILLGTFGGAAETARYLATRTLLRPVGIILTAMDDADRTQASHALAEGRLVQLARWYHGARYIPAVIALVPLLPTFMFGEELATLLYGDKFSGLEPIVRLSVVLFLFMAWLLPKTIYLITAGYARELARAALISFGFTLLVLGTFVAAGYATAMAFVGADVCGATVLAALLLLTIHRGQLTLMDSGTRPAVAGEVSASVARQN